MTANEHNPLKFVGMGEVLFDVFEDGAATMGGAPLNVAVHAHQLAAACGLGEGLVVSRVGDDLTGKQIRDALLDRGMSTRYLQTDPVHSTGSVSVFMLNGDPGYQFEPDAAWDFLERHAVLDDLAESCHAVCFGSLAQRSARSRETIRAFVRRAKNAVRLYDVNLRRNTLTHDLGYSADILERSCEIATIVKVNWAELMEVGALFGVKCSLTEECEMMRELAGGIMRRLCIPTLVVTRGAKGTTLFTGQREFHGHAPPLTVDDAHPVGAGDACTAGILLGALLGLDPNAAVDLGNRMGAWVASDRAATPRLPDDLVNFAKELVCLRHAGQGDSLVETA